LTILGLCIWQASAIGIGSGLVLWSLGGLVAFIPIPFLVYRIYALRRGDYLLDREVLTIRWGLRSERIPIPEVEWIRAADDLTHPLRFPFFSIPGAILGIRLHPDLGLVEFLAAEARDMLLVSTPQKVFAISPANPLAFTQDFQRTLEKGSLVQANPQSLYPSFVIAQAWQSKLTRALWLSGLLLNIGLLVWVSLLAPGLEFMPFGFLTAGVPKNIVPGVQLFLLPVISILFSAIAWLAGISYFRRPNMRSLALLIWGFSALSSFLFLMAVLYIISFG
jgi:hypothetical protein